MDFADLHPQELGGTYMQYKRKQAKFTAWLREAAAKVTPKPTQVAKTTTWSGRKTRHPQTAADPQAKLHTRDLERMAHMIADRRKIGEIPEEPINMLRDVVMLRKGCADFYSAAASKSKNDQLGKDNATHNYMILTLERVLRILEAKVCRQPKPSQSTVKTPQKSNLKQESQVEEPAKTLTKDKGLGNMFANLEVFPVGHDTPGTSDEVEVSTVAHTTSRPREIKSKKGKYTQPLPPAADSEWEDEENENDGENENDEDSLDAYIFVYCVFEDFNAIQDHVVEKWCDYFYEDTSIRVETLAAITNAAYEIFHRMQEELERHPANANPNTNLGSYSWIFFNLITSGPGKSRKWVEPPAEGNTPAKPRVDVGGPDETWGRISKILKEGNFSEDTYISFAIRPWHILRSLFENPHPYDMIPRLCPDHRDFSNLYGRIDISSLFDHDWYTTKDFSQDLSVLRLHKTDGRLDYLLPAEPELNLDFQDAFRMRSLRTFGRQKTVTGRNHDTVAFIFSLQLFLDIRRTLETRAHEAFDTMHATARRVHAALVRHLDHVDPQHPHTHHTTSHPQGPPCAPSQASSSPTSLTDPPRDPEEPDPKLPLPLPDYTAHPPHSHRLLRLLHRRIHDLSDFVLRDPIHHPDMEYELSPDRFHLLRRDPVWAGLLSLRARLVAATLGREACETTGIVDAAACLYRAARAAGDGVPEWEAMEAWTRRGGVVDSGGGDQDGGVDAAVEVLGRFRAAEGREATRRPRGRGPLEILGGRYGGTFRSGGRHLGYLREMMALRGGSATDTTGTDVRPLPIKMLEALEEALESGLDGELDMDYFGLFDGSVRVLKAFVQSDVGGEYGLLSVWAEGGDVEQLTGAVPFLARAAADPKGREEVVQGMVKVVRTVLGDVLSEEAEEYSGEDPADYEEERPGKLPRGTAIVVRKTGRWAMGWGDDSWKVVKHVGPLPETVTNDDELRERIWSTHELSEKYDRFMRPRKM